VGPALDARGPVCIVRGPVAMAEPKLVQKTEDEAPTARAEVTSVPPVQDGAWTRPAGLSPRGWGVLGFVILLFNVPLIHRALRPAQPATVTLPYADDFSNPETLGRDYWNTGGHWRTVNGELLSPGVKNNPLWLKASLPQDVAVEFDARSESPEGDLKVELFGDGLNHASGYVFIHGGWANRFSIIARLDEHGPSLEALRNKANGKDLVSSGVFRRDTGMRVEGRHSPVQVGRTYRWRIERRGSLIRWFIDGQPYMELDDPFPLAGKGHDRFGFSSWDAQLFFDNLKVEPLR
jgi:hypothetical protein